MMNSANQVRFLDRTTPPHIATLVMMTGVSALTMSVFLPSLPRMTEYFQADYRTMQLSVALFLAMNGALQLIIGPLSDRFGRRPVLLAGFAIFTVASLGCVFAPTTFTFLAFRMLQAAVVVAMALSRAVVRDMYDASRSASMIAYVTMGMSLVPMAGPALGGWLAKVADWQASFWLLAVLGALMLVLIWADLGETSKTMGKPFRQQIAEYPLLFASPRFWGYTLAGALSSGTFFAYLGGAPFVGSEIFGLPPATVGILLGVPAWGYLVGNYVTSRYSMTVGIDKLTLYGSLTCTFGLVLSLAVYSSGYGTTATFFGLMTFIGFGNGLVLPNSAAGMLSVRPSLAGTASGLGGALQIGGGALLSALAGAMLTVETGAAPLLWIMLASAVLSVLAIVYVIRRTAQLG